MFHWHKEIDRLDIPAAKVFHLERSLSAVQVALPGLPSQDAAAYLCVYSLGKGLRAALVLHLLTSRRLAFYLHDEEVVPQQDAARLIAAGADFAESLGFMLSDVDYRKLNTQQRASLWGSLPLKNGIETPVPSPDVATAIDESAVTVLPEMPVAGRGSSVSPTKLPVAADEAITELLEESDLLEEMEPSVASDEPEKPTRSERALELEEPAVSEELDLPVEFEEPEASDAAGWHAGLEVAPAAAGLIRAVEIESPEGSEQSLAIDTPDVLVAAELAGEIEAHAVLAESGPARPLEKAGEPEVQVPPLRMLESGEMSPTSADDLFTDRPDGRSLPGVPFNSESDEVLDFVHTQHPFASERGSTVRPPVQKKLPSAEEARACRQKFLESLGRFLVSL